MNIYYEILKLVVPFGIGFLTAKVYQLIKRRKRK